MLYSTGSSAWCSMMTWVGDGGWGEAQEGGDMCIHKIKIKNPCVRVGIKCFCDCPMKH